MIVAFLARIRNWWEASALARVVSVFTLMVACGVVIACCETMPCFRLAQICCKTTTNENAPKWGKTSKLTLKATCLRQRRAHSDVRRQRCLIKDDEDEQLSPSQSPSNDHGTINNNCVGCFSNENCTPARALAS